jgi:hypothetical protein
MNTTSEHKRVRAAYKKDLPELVGILEEELREKFEENDLPKMLDASYEQMTPQQRVEFASQLPELREMAEEEFREEFEDSLPEWREKTKKGLLKKFEQELPKRLASGLRN